MANTVQARKRARQDEVRNANNSQLRSRYRTAIKAVRKVATEGNHTTAMTFLSQAYSVIDSVARKGIIHRNKAARHKSRLNKLVKSMLSPAVAAA